MGFFKTQEEERMKGREKLKVEIQRRNESREKAFQEQNKKNEKLVS